jgi:4-hydroxymandelate oxidase
VLALLADLAARAEAVLDPDAAAFFATGSGEEVSLRAAEEAWRQWALRPRALAAVGQADTGVRLLGTDLDTPVLAAPTAHQRLAHPDGELATAEGVREAGALMVLSSRSSSVLEEVAARVPGRWWFQVYVMQQRAVTASLVERAAAAGACALVLTGDTPVVGRKFRSYGVPAGFDDLELVNVRDHVPPDADVLAAIVQDPGVGRADIGWLRDLSGLPVLVKGILRSDDALACAAAGAAGIIVSNHGGRQLDRAVPTAYALPEVVDALSGRLPVLVDGGIRSGLDVLTALALGADAVLLGRPVVWGLAADGARGVRAVLEGLTDDLAHAMVLAGAADVAAVDRSLVVPCSWWPR